jgi:hypothetical protein
MEASFSYLQQHTKLAALLRETQTKGQAMLDQPALPSSAKAQLVAQIKTLETDILKNESERRKWDGDLKVYLAYVERHSLLKNTKVNGTASALLRQDQAAVQDAYRTCLRGCSATDNACKATCNEKANASDASKRMLRCRDLATNFK